MNECDKFLQRLNHALDGRDVSSLAADGHLNECTECHDEYSMSKSILRLAENVGVAHTLSTPLPRARGVQTDFAAAVIARVERENRSSLRQRIIAATASFVLAASVLVALLALPKTDEQAKLPETRVTRPIAEAREAIVNLSAKVADDTIAPARSLVSAKASPALATADSPLQDATDAAKAGVAPILDQPRRALNLLFRDASSVVGRRS